MFTIIGLYILFIILNCFDFYLTKRALELGYIEGNPIVRWVLSNFGLLGFALLKVMVIILIAACLDLSILLCLDIFYIIVIIHNARLIIND